MMAMSLELSDEIARLATDFEQFTHGGIVMDGDTVFGIVAKLGRLKRLARDLENEVSQKRWNELAREERAAEVARVLNAATAPGSNVKLFPVIHRPFSDGRSGGAA